MGGCTGYLIGKPLVQSSLNSTRGITRVFRGRDVFFSSKATVPAHNHSKCNRNVTEFAPAVPARVRTDRCPGKCTHRLKRLPNAARCRLFSINNVAGVACGCSRATSKRGKCGLFFSSPLPLLLAYGTMGIEMAIAPLWVKGKRKMTESSKMRTKLYSEKCHMSGKPNTCCAAS